MPAKKLVPVNSSTLALFNQKRKYGRFGNNSKPTTVNTVKTTYKTKSPNFTNKAPMAPLPSNVLQKRTHNTAFGKPGNLSSGNRMVVNNELKRARHGDFEQSEKTLFK